MRLEAGEKILREDSRVRVETGRGARRFAERRALMVEQTPVDVFQNQIDEFAHGDVVHERIFRLKDQMPTELLR